MIDGVPLSAADVGGFGLFIALALAVVVAFMRGWIASRREVDAEKARADSWQQAWAVERSANREKDQMISEVLEHSRTSAHALEQIQHTLTDQGAEP